MIEDRWKSLSLIPVQFWLKMTSLTSRSKSFGSPSRDPLGSFGKQAVIRGRFRGVGEGAATSPCFSCFLKSLLTVFRVVLCTQSF